MQCLALLQIVRDHCASAEVVVAQPSCLSICCARPAEAAEVLSVTEPPGQWRERRTDINRCALVARVTMIVEAAAAAGGKKAGGGGGGKKASKPVRVFVQATSLAQTMPAVTTGEALKFTHGQRSARKATPAVNGVFPGSWTDGAEETQHWDGVNLFKHYPNKPAYMDDVLKKCAEEAEGKYSLSSVSMQVSDWPRGNGCHKPDTTLRALVGDKQTVVTSSTELHKAYENSPAFDDYSFDCVKDVSSTSTGYNFFMAAQNDCFLPGIIAVAERLLAAAEHGRYVDARDLEVVADIEGVPVGYVVDPEFLTELDSDMFVLGQPVTNVELPLGDDESRTPSQQTMADIICAVYLLKLLLPPCDTPTCAAYAYDVGLGKQFRYPPTLKCCWSSSVSEAVCTLLSAMFAAPMPTGLPTKSVSQQDLANFVWQTVSPAAALMGCINQAATHKWYVAEAMTVILGPTHWLLTKLLENGVSTASGLATSRLIGVENSADYQKDVITKDPKKPGAALHDQAPAMYMSGFNTGRDVTEESVQELIDHVGDQGGAAAEHIPNTAIEGCVAGFAYKETNQFADLDIDGSDERQLVDGILRPAGTWPMTGNMPFVMPGDGPIAALEAGTTYVVKEAVHMRKLIEQETDYPDAAAFERAKKHLSPTLRQGCVIHVAAVTDCADDGLCCHLTLIDPALHKLIHGKAGALITMRVLHSDLAGKVDDRAETFSAMAVRASKDGVLVNGMFNFPLANKDQAAFDVTMNSKSVKQRSGADITPEQDATGTKCEFKTYQISFGDVVILAPAVRGGARGLCQQAIFAGGYVSGVGVADKKVMVVPLVARRVADQKKYLKPPPAKTQVQDLASMVTLPAPHTMMVLPSLLATSLNPCQHLQLLDNTSAKTLTSMAQILTETASLVQQNSLYDPRRGKTKAGKTRRTDEGDEAAKKPKKAPKSSPLGSKMTVVAEAGTLKATITVDITALKIEDCDLMKAKDKRSYVFIGNANVEVHSTKAGELVGTLQQTGAIDGCLLAANICRALPGCPAEFDDDVFKKKIESKDGKNIVTVGEIPGGMSEAVYYLGRAIYDQFYAQRRAARTALLNLLPKEWAVALADNQQRCELFKDIIKKATDGDGKLLLEGVQVEVSGYKPTQKAAINSPPMPSTAGPPPKKQKKVRKPPVTERNVNQTPAAGGGGLPTANTAEMTFEELLDLASRKCVEKLRNATETTCKDMVGHFFATASQTAMMTTTDMAIRNKGNRVNVYDAAAYAFEQELFAVESVPEVQAIAARFEVAVKRKWGELNSGKTLQGDSETI